MNSPDTDARKTSPHETRNALSNEWHARPLLSLPAPLRCTHLVRLRSDLRIDERRDEFAVICRDQGQAEPAHGSRHHAIQAGHCLLKWEGHTEADAYTLLVSGNSEPPFGTTALSFLDESVRTTLQRELFVGVQVEVVPCSDSDGEQRQERARALLGTREIYGGSVSELRGEIWSSFRLDGEGFVRLLLMDCGMGEARVARNLQRLLEIESYRMLAMLALPAARDVMATLGQLEPELDEVMAELARKTSPTQEALLERLSDIAARAEHLAAVNAYRFAAARAYQGIVDKRLAELAEAKIASAPRYTTFLQKSLLPAMRTCDAAERRTRELAQRVTRATQLLNSMVDLDQKKQNQAILESMAERANLQLRLQQSVEGFSIFAITYYAVGLVGYLLKSAKSLGAPVDPTLLTGISAPIVLAVVWLSVRRVKKHITR